MKAEIWTVSFVASLGLHVLVVAALIGFGSLPSSTPSAPSAPSEQPPAAVAATTPESQVPVPAADKDAGPVPAVDTAPVPVADKYYTVKAGDNLTKIAKLDGSTLAELAELNDKSIKELARLKVGQRIKVKNGVEQ